MTVDKCIPEFLVNLYGQGERQATNLRNEAGKANQLDKFLIQPISPSILFQKVTNSEKLPASEIAKLILCRKYEL
jgi:hypothetical protein